MFRPSFLLVGTLVVWVTLLPCLLVEAQDISQFDFYVVGDQGGTDSIYGYSEESNEASRLYTVDRLLSETELSCDSPPSIRGIERQDKTLFVRLRYSPTAPGICDFLTAVIKLNLETSDASIITTAFDNAPADYIAIDPFNNKLFSLLQSSATDGLVVSYPVDDDELTDMETYDVRINFPRINGLAVVAGSIVAVDVFGSQFKDRLISFPADQLNPPLIQVSPPLPEGQRYTCIEIYCLDEAENECFVYTGVKDTNNAASRIIRYKLDDLASKLPSSDITTAFITDCSIGMDQVLYALTDEGSVYEFDASNLNILNPDVPVPFPTDVSSGVYFVANVPPSPEDPRSKFFLVFVGIAIVLLLVGLVVGKLDLRRTLTAVPEETDKTNKCFLLTSQRGDQSQAPDEGDNTPNGASLTQVDQTLQDVVARMETHQAFSTDILQSLYTSLLSGLVDDSASQDGLHMDAIIQDAVALVDQNKDGFIDTWEMEHIQLPAGKSGEFLFEDVVACTGVETSTEGSEASLDDLCVTAENVVDFVNLFFGGTAAVSPELAQHLREESGADTCFTRTEFENLFQSSLSANNTHTLLLSAASATLSMNPFSLVLGLEWPWWCMGSPK